MKKVFVMFLSLVLILSFTACTNSDSPNSSLISSDTISSDDFLPSDLDDNSSTVPSNTDITFFESAVSKHAQIEFKDQSGNVLINASDVSKVYAKQTVEAGYTIQIDFTPDGTQKFEDATRANIGKVIEIYIDSELIMSPVVNDAITDGKVIIDGLGTKEDMLKMYEKLTSTEVPKAATLPLPQDVTEFVFSSGAGAWSTVLELTDTGSFTGNFHDSEMGSFTDESPKGIVYLSVFYGQFTNIEKINDYSYKMTLANVQTRDKVDSEWIDDGIRYIASSPYGIDGGTEFILYLPDTPISELPEDFLTWWPLRFGSDEKPTTLSCYGILNVATNDGFFTWYTQKD